MRRKHVLFSTMLRLLAVSFLCASILMEASRIDPTLSAVEKTVLVSLGPRTRAVTFSSSSDLDALASLEEAIRKAFVDSPLLSANCRVIVQVCIAFKLQVYMYNIVQPLAY